MPLEEVKMFKITEWEWFKVQLRLHALEYSAAMFGKRYQFNATVPNIAAPANKLRVPVLCTIYGQQVQTMTEKGDSREEQLAYYRDWVEGEKQLIDRVLEDLPDLRSRFDPNRDVAFVIVYNYGMGGHPVCTFIHGAVHWSETGGRPTQSRK